MYICKKYLNHKGMALKFNFGKQGPDYEERAKLILFGRWLAMNYSTSELNYSDGAWWAETARHYDETVTPVYNNDTLYQTIKICEDVDSGVYVRPCTKCHQPIDRPRSNVCQRCYNDELPF